MKTEIKQNIKTFAEGGRISLKLVIITFMVLLLLIPKFMVMDLVKERGSTMKTVTSSISSQIGGSQVIVGPILCVPYTYTEYTYTTVNGKNENISEVKNGFAYFTPDSLLIDSKVEVNERQKSIYKVNVFSANNSLKFSFPKNVEVDHEHLIEENWDKAYLVVGSSDLLGIMGTPSLKSGINELSFETGIRSAHFLGSGAHLNVEKDWITSGEQMEMTFNVRGTKSLNFAPIAQLNKLKMSSENWSDVNFESVSNNYSSYYNERQEIVETGSSSILPDGKPEINNDDRSFSAEWTISGFNMQMAKQWTASAPNLTKKLIGAKFISVADHYSKTERSVKYMILFIGLIYLVFFISELLTKRRIHPFQYVLVGAGIIIFFVLLLAIAEYVGFNNSYFISSIATILLISLYSSSVFKKKSLTLLLAGLLTALFIFLFVIIQAAQYSLLIGAIGLFVILALVMYFTRKVNWSGSKED